MKRPLRVAALQTAAHDRARLTSAWPALRHRIRDAAGAGAQLIVAPEGTLPAYVLGYEPYAAAEIASQVEECATLARELQAVLAIGVARREKDRTYNSAIVFDADGSTAGAADKHFLWHFDRQWFAQGERLHPIRTSIGMLGVLICADGRIPTIARTLVDLGAEVLVMPTAWVTSGRDAKNLENIQADLLARVRAKENGVPFVAANKCGVELGCVAYCGKSQVVAADGTLLALADELHEETIAATIEIGDTAHARKAMTAFTVPASRESPRTAARVAIAARDFTDEAFMERRLRILEAQMLVMPSSTYPAAGGDAAPAYVNDDIVLDPAGLAAYRRAGVEFAVWTTSLQGPWQTAFARARALELRMYVGVIDANARAYAVDPDGAILCGTFDRYEIASFTYDPARARQTLVAPGTDVRTGLERTYEHAPH